MPFWQGFFGMSISILQLLGGRCCSHHCNITDDGRDVLFPDPCKEKRVAALGLPRRDVTYSSCLK